MQAELQMIISVLTAGQPEEINENYLRNKLDLSVAAFKQQYHSYASLLEACTHYCVFMLQTELEVVWRLSVNTVQKLYYSLVVLQRPENQKRRRYFQIIDVQYPLLAAEVRKNTAAFIQEHFQLLLDNGKQDGLIQPQIQPPVTATRLWYLNGVTLQHSLEAEQSSYWLEEVVHVLWPLVSELFTSSGKQAMEVSLASYPKTFNQYGQ